MKINGNLLLKSSILLTFLILFTLFQFIGHFGYLKTKFLKAKSAHPNSVYSESSSNIQKRFEKRRDFLIKACQDIPKLTETEQCRSIRATLHKIAYDPKHNFMGCLVAKVSKSKF